MSQNSNAGLSSRDPKLNGDWPYCVLEFRNVEPDQRSKAPGEKSALYNAQWLNILVGTSPADMQGELDFGSAASADGHAKWLAGRQMAARELARRMNLPLGHEVEVWLTGGIMLRGKLRVKEELLFIEEDKVRHLELIVDRMSFTYRELESCVRLD